MKTILTTTKRPEVTSHFPFQKIPPELRNAIYHLHLVQVNEKTHLSKSKTLHHRAEVEAYRKVINPEYTPPHYKYTALSILGVSRQLHDEALGIFYHHNSLRLNDVAALRDFLISIGPKRRSFLRDLTFGYQGFGSPAAFKLLAGCERLTTLHIQVSYNTMWRATCSGPMGTRTLLTSPGMGHLLKIRGSGTVDFSYGWGLNKKHEKEFEKTVRAALLQPKKVVKARKRGEKSGEVLKSGKGVAGKTHTGKSEGASRGKKTKLDTAETTA